MYTQRFSGQEVSDRDRALLTPPTAPTEGRVCRECLCTDEDACTDELTGEACHWVEPGLCSFCKAA